jgi:CheY-like chemotaxis protein
MIEPSTQLVTGTVEVGYDKRCRKYIYEQDIQILKNFIDYAVNFLERRKTDMIDKIMHEFKSPLAGLRSNIDFLLRHKLNDKIMHVEKDDKDYIVLKLNDMLTDSEIEELEHLLGSPNSRQLKFTRTIVVRDIIIKTINQLSPILKERGFSSQQIQYHAEDSNKIVVETDRAKLNQVVYNLLMNSIKYSKQLPNSLKKDPKQFKVLVEVEEENDKFIIKFYDGGIGIEKNHRDKIFEQGFRSSQAQAMDESGSGLGLNYPKNHQSHKGDLKMILFVDNEPRRMEVYLEEFRLPEHNYHIEIMTDIDSALDFFEEKHDKIELIILDIMMPVSSRLEKTKVNGGLRTGIAFYQKIRETNKDLPIIFFTNVSNLNNKEVEQEIHNNPKKIKLLQKVDTLPYQLVKEVKEML